MDEPPHCGFDEDLEGALDGEHAAQGHGHQSCPAAVDAYPGGGLGDMVVPSLGRAATSACDPQDRDEMAVQLFQRCNQEMASIRAQTLAACHTSSQYLFEDELHPNGELLSRMEAFGIRE